MVDPCTRPKRLQVSHLAQPGVRISPIRAPLRASALVVLKQLGSRDAEHLCDSVDVHCVSVGAAGLDIGNELEVVAHLVGQILQ